MGGEGGEVLMTTMVNLEDITLHFPLQRGIVSGARDLLSDNNNKKFTL